jgi:hypothetical protein
MRYKPNVPHGRVSYTGELATPKTHQKVELLHLNILTTSY